MTTVTLMCGNPLFTKRVPYKNAFFTALQWKLLSQLFFILIAMTETQPSNFDQVHRHSIFIPYTKENISKYLKLFPQIDLNGPLEEEGAWHEGRFIEDARESTGTELKGKWEFSEFVVLVNRPIAYLIGTYGIKDYLWVPEKDIFIFRLGVKLCYRGCGIGTRLIHNLAWKMVKHKICGIHLETSSTNRRAHKFYEKLGFKRVGQHIDPKKDILFYNYSGEVAEILTRTSRFISPNIADRSDEH